MQESNRKVNSFSTFLKYSLKEPRERWVRLPVADIPEHIQKTDRRAYRDGRRNIYLYPYLYDDNAPKSPLTWLILDIEHTDGKGHKDTAKNIDAARTVLELSAENSLLKGLHIALTGHGFRFVWPYYIPFEKKELFFEFLSDFPEIDAGIHRDKKFIRICGYRGHADQSKNRSEIQDVHIRYLPEIHPDILSGLTPDEYRETVAGPGSYADLKIIPSILPRQEIPAEWHTFLEKYQRKISLKNSIFKGFGSGRKPGTIPAEVIEKLVSDAGIQTGKIIEREAGTVLKLRKCPVCAREGAYVTASGRLKCNHTSCSAGSERNDQGWPVGIPPQEWLPELAEHIREPEPLQNEDSAEIRSAEEIREALTEAIKGNDDLLVRTACGSGKTTTGLKVVIPMIKEMKRSVLWAVPTNLLKDEAYDIALPVGTETGVRVKKIDGRNSENCAFYPKIEKAISFGHSPALTVCPGCIYKREKNCIYYDQFRDLEKPGLYLIAHKHLNYLETKNLKKADPKLIVIDESFAETFFEKTGIRSDRVLFFHSRPSISFFYEKVSRVIAEHTAVHTAEISGFRSQKTRSYENHIRIYAGPGPKGSQWENREDLFTLAGFTEAEIETVHFFVAEYSRRPGENAISYARRVFNDNIDLKALRWLVRALKRDGSAYIRINSGNHHMPVEFVTFECRTPDLQGIRIVNFDATGSRDEVKAIFRRDFREMAFRTVMPCRKSWLRQKTGKMKISKMEADKLKKLVRRGVKKLATEDRKILVICHKCRKDEILTMAKDLMPDRTVEATHFGQGRGLNRWKNFDAAICIGWSNVNRLECMDMAMAMFPEKRDQEKWFEHKGWAEVYQAVHRIRLIFGGKHIIIIADKWLSELGEPDTTEDLRRGCQKTSSSLEEAYARCRAFVEKTGWISLNIPEALAVGSAKNLKNIKQTQMNIRKYRLSEISQKRMTCFIEDIFIRHVIRYRENFSGQNSYENQNISDDYQEKSGKAAANPLPEIILFDRRNCHWWTRILSRLREEFPELPELELKINGTWSKGLGYLQSVRKTYEEIGVTEYSPKAWRGTECPEPEMPEAEKSIRAEEPGDIQDSGKICEEIGLAEYSPKAWPGVECPEPQRISRTEMRVSFRYMEEPLPVLSAAFPDCIPPEQIPVPVPQTGVAICQ